MTWVLAEDVAQVLIDYGFDYIVSDLTTQTLSLCGSDMNVSDSSGDNYTIVYDNTGYINEVYNGYIAPVNNFDFGCGFEFACNYDPCVLDDFELCEFLNVSVETTPDDGMGSERLLPRLLVERSHTLTRGLREKPKILSPMESV